ncbi:MAG: hypothetical protein GX799_05505 [Crenarchaeota archaeon]|nr:hypothetical protein [Thermoproteota archaeon]
METTIQFSTSLDAKRWLESQTVAVLTPVNAQAKKLRDDMNLQVQAIMEVSKSLLDASTKEIEKRNMKVYNRARALNKLARLFIDRFKKLTAPEHVTYDSINKYVQEIQRVFLVTEIDLKNWFPRISPFFIMDRRKFLATYEKAKQTYTYLNDYVTKEYVKAKTLEEALQQLNDLQGIEKHLLTIQEDKDNIKNERIPIEQEIADLEEKIYALQNKGPINKLKLINIEIENLNNELKNTLRHLQKPFIKMQALAISGGGGGITPDELAKVNQYIDNPFEALAQEQNGYPLLKEVLLKLESLIAKDKLKLKPDKARKAEQTTKEILQNDLLANQQERFKELAQTRDDLLSSAKLDEVNRNLAQYQEQIIQLKARKTSVETHESVKANTYQETVDKISNLKRIVEKNIAAALDKSIQIA